MCVVPGLDPELEGIPMVMLQGRNTSVCRPISRATGCTGLPPGTPRNGSGGTIAGSLGLCQDNPPVRVAPLSKLKTGWARSAPKRYNSCVVEPTSCIIDSVWNVGLELVESWLLGLDQDSYEQVIAALELLAERGPQLGRPLVDTVVSSRHRNMKELRPGSSGRSELRILFAFDPERHAILLVAGDKAGNWTKWYKTNIPIADELFEDHLRILKGGS